MKQSPKDKAIKQGLNTLEALMECKTEYEAADLIMNNTEELDALISFCKRSLRNKQ